KVLRPSVSPAAAGQLKVLGRVVLAGPFDVVAHEQIQIAVPVIVQPPATAAPLLIVTGDTRRLGDIFELAVTLVVKQAVRTDRRDERSTIPSLSQSPTAAPMP